MATAKKVKAAYEKKRATLTTSEETGAAKHQRERVTALLAKAAEKTQETVVKSLATLKVSLTESVDAISNRLSAEIQTLKEVEEAIAAQKETLQTLHDIEAQANTLEVLIETQNDQREEFQNEMSMTRAAWEEEKKLNATRRSEEKAQLDKNRKWEEEQYTYELTKRRQQEQDEWVAKRRVEQADYEARWNAKMVELNAREMALEGSEEEVTALQAQVAKFDETLKKEVGTAVAIATNSLKKDLTNEHRIEKMTIENTLSLKTAEIATLNTRVAELQKVNGELQTKYTDATNKVQQIAEKAIEGASKSAPVFQLPTNDSTNDKRRG